MPHGIEVLLDVERCDNGCESLFIVECSIGVRTRSSWSVISMPCLTPAWLASSEFCIILENFLTKIFSKGLDCISQAEGSV